MANAFEIKNFKGFNETMRIELAPITLIYGVNSAGKSSIIDALRMVQHSPPNGLSTYGESDFDLGDPNVAGPGLTILEVGGRIRGGN